jgi:hypothetical protein
LLLLNPTLMPVWSNGQSSWLQIQRSWFDSRPYQVFWKVVDLERGPLSHLSTIEEQLGRKTSDSGLEIREYDCRDASRWPRGTFYPQKLALTSPTSGGRSVGIVRSRTRTFNESESNRLLYMQYKLRLGIEGPLLGDSLGRYSVRLPSPATFFTDGVEDECRQ